MLWWRSESKNATCCQWASESEIAANPDAFNCDTCEFMPRIEGLWSENAEAWQTYHLLCGRTVRDWHLEGWLLDRWTAGWTIERTVALVDRLNLIGSVLEPDGPTQN